jgi:succinate-semialdehyde dehydrogenase/glutarate-semialdehyde dehydrogenase
MCPQCALAIEEIFCRAGFEDGVFQTLLIEPEQVEKLIVDARVKAVTVTGSEKAGAASRAQPRVKSRKVCSSWAAAMHLS